jgi:hypothetical protein
MIQWQSIFRVPLNKDVEVRVTDGVEEYRLGFSCFRTEDGWIMTKSKVPLPSRLKPVAWRERE